MAEPGGAEFVKVEIPRPDVAFAMTDPGNMNFVQTATDLFRESKDAKITTAAETLQNMLDESRKNAGDDEWAQPAPIEIDSSTLEALFNNNDTDLVGAKKALYEGLTSEMRNKANLLVTSLDGITRTQGNDKMAAYREKAVTEFDRGVVIVDKHVDILNWLGQYVTPDIQGPGWQERRDITVKNITGILGKMDALQSSFGSDFPKVKETLARVEMHAKPAA